MPETLLPTFPNPRQPIPVVIDESASKNSSALLYKHYNQNLVPSIGAGSGNWGTVFRFSENIADGNPFLLQSAIISNKNAAGVWLWLAGELSPFVFSAYGMPFYIPGNSTICIDFSPAGYFYFATASQPNTVCFVASTSQTDPTSLLGSDDIKIMVFGQLFV